MTATFARLNSQMLDNRIDATYYRPEYIANELRLRESGLDVVPLGSLVTSGRRAVYFDTSTLEESAAPPDWLPFLTADDFGADGFFLNLNSRRRVSTDFGSRYPNGRLRANELLVKVKGPNQITAYNEREPERVILVSGTIWGALVRRESVDPHYLVTALSSTYAATARTRVRTNLNVEFLSPADLMSLDLPLPRLKDAQKYIGDKIRFAERLLEVHRELGACLKEQMRQCFRGQLRPTQKRHSVIAAAAINTLRMEAEYYEPLALWAEEEIKGSQWSYEPLSELATRIKDGPGGWGVSTNDYVPWGVPVVRGVNLEDGECDLTGCVFLTPNKHEELRSHCTYRGNVLLSVRGTIGRSAVFDIPEFDEANLNAAVVTIECKDRILPHFLAEYFNSEIGCIQSARIANGAVQQNMNLTETGNNLIVVPPKSFQELIVAQRVKWLACRRFGKALVLSAKLIVEGLIEGRVSERDLSDAQQALSRGDASLDRFIMSRLRHDGIDGSGTPVVADLDALYTTMDEAQRTQPDNGDAV